MAESFCRFFELKSFLFEFYFFELYLFESSIGSMMISTISPGSRGSLAASWPATAVPRACGPPAAVACRDLAILPRLPGEIVYIYVAKTTVPVAKDVYMGRLMRKGTQRPQPQSGENRDQNHDVS